MSDRGISTFSPRGRNDHPGIFFPILFGVLLLGFYWFVGGGDQDPSLHRTSGYVAAALCYLTTLIEVRIGLAVMVIAIGVSPEVGTGRMADLRVEDVLIPAVFFAWVTRLIVNREALYPTPLKGPILGYLLVGLLTTLGGVTMYNVEIDRAAIFYLKTVQYFLIFLVVLNNVRSHAQAKFFIILMVASSFLTGIYGLVLSQGLGATGRLAGPSGEGANIMGGYYAFHIALVTGLLTRARSGMRLPLILGAVFLLGLPLMRTASRASLIALLAGIGAMALLDKRRVLAGLFAVFLILPVLMPHETAERFLSILALVPGSERSVPSSFTHKAASWRDNFHTQILEYPLLGQGFARFSLAHVDNEYIKVLIEVGFVGFLFFVAILVQMFRTALATYRTTSDPLYKSFSLGYLGALTVILIHNWASTSMTTIRTMEPLMFATGILGALYYMEILRSEARDRRGGRRADEEEAPSPSRPPRRSVNFR